MMRVKVDVVTRLDVYKQVQARIAALGGGYTKVGFPDGVPPATVANAPSSTISEVATIAAYNEFGTKRIPARPFFRQAVDNNRAGLSAFVAAVYAKVLDGSIQTRQGLALIGEWMTAKVKESITTGGWKPNAPITIARKKSTRPLIDTGQMRQSVTHVEHVV